MIKTVKKNATCFCIALLLTPLIIFRIFQSVSLEQIAFFSVIMVLFCNFVNKPEPLLECITLFLNLIIATWISNYFPKQGHDYLFLLVMSCLAAHVHAYSLIYACILSCGIIFAIVSMTDFGYIQILLFLLFSFLFFSFRHISFHATNYFSVPTQKLFGRQVAILLSLLYFYVVVIVYFSLWHNFVWTQNNQSYIIKVCANRSEIEIFLTYTAMLFCHGTIYAVEPVSSLAILLSTATMTAGMLVNVFYAGIVIAYVVQWRDNRNLNGGNNVKFF